MLDSEQEEILTHAEQSTLSVHIHKLEHPCKYLLIRIRKPTHWQVNVLGIIFHPSNVAVHSSTKDIYHQVIVGFVGDIAML